MKDKKYDDNGYLVVSEIDSCSLWKKDANPCYGSCENDCFYCAFSNFRQDDYVQNVAGKATTEPLYSICKNEKNRRKESLKEDKNED